MTTILATRISTANAAFTPHTNTTTCMELDLFAHITHVAESKQAFTIWIQAEGNGYHSNTTKQNQNALVSAIKKRMHRVLQMPS